MLDVVLYVCIITSVIQALPDYQSRIPNGDNVIHPCFGNDMWPGVGHQSHSGGGVLNPFGKDFMDNGYKWEECLCTHDSDGDGKTNGEELGDPNCLFTEGGIPQTTEGITHPGVCDPVDSPQCDGLNAWEVCQAVDFKCDDIEEPDVDVYDLIFPETVIPEEETTYYCMAVEFNDTYDAHAFAMEPYLVNRDLVHHIDLNECTGNADEIKRDYPVPGPCSDMPNCQGNALGAWSLGMSGICLPSDVGIKIGKTGARVAVLRIHYHNPMHRVNETDRSGLKLYASRVLRQKEASIFNFHQMYLEIPPGQPEYAQETSLTEFCTNSWDEDVHLMIALFHMHYLGIGAVAELYRDGEFVQDIFRDDHFRFDAPTFKQFHTPIIVKPNDTIRLVCIFHSMDRAGITWRGQASTDEMCEVNFVYYPQQAFTSAFNRGVRQSCSFHPAFGIASRDNWDDLCDKNGFDTIYNEYIRDALLSACDENGLVCEPGCEEVLEWAYGNHSCLRPEVRSAIFANKREFALMQSSCKDYPDPVTTPEPTTRDPNYQGQLGSCVSGQSGGCRQNPSIAVISVMMIASLMIMMMWNS